MTIAGMSPRYPDTVRPMSQSGQDELRAHTGRAGNPDNPEIVGVLKAAHSCQICGTVAAPVAQESCYLWLPVIHN